MKCPIDSTIDLVMTDRQGIEIDYCPTCRGVWLDRGELDKIIERAAAALPRPAPEVMVAPTAAPLAAQQVAPQPDQRVRRRDDDWDDDWDDDDRRRQVGYDQPGHPGYKKKKRSSLLGELFDF